MTLSDNNTSYAGEFLKKKTITDFEKLNLCNIHRLKQMALCKPKRMWPSLKVVPSEVKLSCYLNLKIQSFAVTDSKHLCLPLD